MIRPLSEKDYNIAIDIVNTNWKRTYSNYVNPVSYTHLSEGAGPGNTAQ